MKKQFVALLMAAAVMMEGSILTAEEPQIQGETQMQTIQAEETKASYATQIGKITEIQKDDNNWRMLVGTPNDGVLFNLHGQEMIINAETLEVIGADELSIGMEVTVVLPKHAPMGLSLPAYCSAQVAIIVNSADRFIEVGYFNEELVNETNTLALNLQKDTTIFNTRGERKIFTEEDIKEQNAVVIYTSTTRSIPAQTTPDMVVILPGEEKTNGMDIEEAEESVESAVVSETEYVAVRELAKEYGYEIKWEHTTKNVILTKEDKSICLVIGEAAFICDDHGEKLSSKVKLVDGKAYVSAELSRYL